VHKILRPVSSHPRSPISGLLRRSAGLAVVLLFSAGLGSAVASSPEASLQPHKSAIRAARGIQPSQSFACTTLGTGCNTTVTGSLTTDDCKLAFDQSFYDAWTFQVTAGQSVQITMSSTSFDTYLLLFDPSGNEVDENCNGLKDCSDPACSTSPSCVTCSPLGASCTQNGQCCSGSCGGKPNRKTCK